MRKVIVIVFTTIFLLSGIGTMFYYQTQEDVEITVLDKERITVSSGDDVESKYLVFTEDETFENVDLLFKLKFNSSDLQGQLQVDSTYTVEVVGWRIPVLSMYRNIVYIKE